MDRQKYDEMVNLAEDVNLLFYDLNRKTGQLMVDGNFDVAMVEANWMKSSILAKLRVAYSHCEMPFKVYVRTARDFAARMNSLRQEIKETRESHGISSMVLEVIY